MSTSLRLEAGADKPTNQRPIAFSALMLLVGIWKSIPPVEN